jgi:ABC-type Mn2+/Zn2+ transport system permease subunit
MNPLSPALLALAIVASIQAVGIVLVIAMLVTPGATAFLLVRRFDAMLAVAAGGAVAATFIGVYVSFFADASTAACIVLVQALGFVAALCLAPRGGLLRRPRQTASSPA